MIDWLKRLVVPVLLLVAVNYAVFGGEYSAFELEAARGAIEVERAQLAQLEREISALEATADSLQTDPATIERVAREEFGMIREGETLYRFAEGDVSTDGGDPPGR